MSCQFSKNLTVETDLFGKVSEDNTLDIPVYFKPGVKYEIMINDEIITATCVDVNTLSFSANELDCSIGLLQPEKVSTNKWKLVMSFQFEWTGLADQAPKDINLVIYEVYDSRTPLLRWNSSQIDVENGIIMLSEMNEALVKYLYNLDKSLREQNIINDSVPLFSGIYPNIQNITERGMHALSGRQWTTEVSVGQ